MNWFPVLHLIVNNAANFNKHFHGSLLWGGGMRRILNFEVHFYPQTVPVTRQSRWCSCNIPELYSGGTGYESWLDY